MKKSPYTNQEIADLVLRARNGEQEAFSELYKCTNDKAYYTAYSIVKNNDDAMDLLQDAYVKAFQSLDTLNNPESFTSWLCRIVSNGCKNYLVKKKPMLFSEMKREDDSEDDEELQIEDTKIDSLPAQVLEDNDLKERIMQLLGNLNEDQRLCMMMVYFHGMKLSEVAEALDVSENTVKSRIFYAKKAMRKEITRYEEEKGIPFNTIVIGPLLRSIFEESSQKVHTPKKLYGRIAKNLSFKKTTLLAKMKGATLTQKVIASVCTLAVVGAAIALPLALSNHDDEITDSLSAKISVSDAGNTPLNISNGGIAAEDDHYLVYIEADSVVNDSGAYALQNERVMLVDKNSGTTQELFTGYVGYLNLIGQNLYYVDLLDNGKLYCYSLTDQEVFSPCIADDKLYAYTPYSTPQSFSLL